MRPGSPRGHESAGLRRAWRAWLWRHVQTVGYIGFSDSWGDLVLKATEQEGTPAGIKVVTNERYGRADTSVTAQILKIVAAHPDAVLTGGSGTPVNPVAIK